MPDGDFASYYTAALAVRKGVPLHRLYEMSYFQRQMDLAGIQNQLGGYIPQTPATMLPFLSFTSLSLLNAKRAWLLENVLLLAASGWLLSRITSFPILRVVALMVVVIGSLHTNILLGQIYALVLMMLTASVLLLEHEQEWAGGFLLGLVFGLKLITAPFLLFFAVKRQWKPLAGMGVALVLGLLSLVFIFGWADLVFYATHILPRSLAGETLDPYNPGNGTLTTFLRRLLIREPELNPSPALESPWLFFFFQPFFALSILWISLLGFASKGKTQTALAGFFIAILVLSPNTASYTFLLLLLPLALLLRRSANVRDWSVLLALVFSLALPLRPAWSWLFPKVWLLLALLAFTVVRYGNPIRFKTASIGVSCALVLSLVLAGIRMASYSEEAGQHWSRIAVERNALYSASPASLPGVITYEALAGNHYVLKSYRNQLVERISQPGDVFDPVSRLDQHAVQFDRVLNGQSQAMLFDPYQGTVQPDVGGLHSDPATEYFSPNGKWTAFVRSRNGSSQVYVGSRGGGPVVQVTHGPCNSITPAWEWNSESILFASDCGRGLGLPALYRAPLSQVPGLQK